MSTERSPRSATRGLATVALLKVNFDAGRDHLAMFEPFVADTIAHMDCDGLRVDDIRAEILERHQLALPVDTLRTLLHRVAKAGFLRREAGRYFRTDKKPEIDDLRVKRQRVEDRQRRLAEALRETSAERGVKVETAEDALAMILSFLERYHVSLALETEADPCAKVGDEPGEEPDRNRDVAMTAAFLQETVLAEGELADVVQEMLEGFILQNTLFLKDISAASRRFKNLRVIFDSGLLFGALGFRGVATEIATKELLTLLKDTGALLDVWEPTIREMRRILAVYVDRIGTSQGRLSLYPTDMTRHFLTNHYAPSDVQTQSTLIERKLKALGFNIRDIPARQARLTLDEADLGARLAELPGTENVPRVVHDINCVAGVLTLRRGRVSEGLDDAGAVFVTTSGLTVRHTSEWYEAQGVGGFPPIIHQLALSNLAWLKRPASASKLKLHELVALCAAALRPSRKAWQAFLDHLRNLQETGELSSDEVTAIVASGLTDNILVEEGVDEDSDADTLSEVVDRVKAAYKAEVGESEATARQLRLHVEDRARCIARTLSWALAALLGVSLIAGTVISIVDLARGETPGALALALALVPLVVVGLFSLLWGFHVKAWRRWLEERLTKRLIQWVAGTS